MVDQGHIWHKHCSPIFDPGIFARKILADFFLAARELILANKIKM